MQIKKEAATPSGDGGALAEPPRLSPLAARVKAILDVVFGGHQSRMAAVVGCSQPMISRVVSGKQEPGPQLIASLAQLNGVKPNWIYSGKGSPVPGGDIVTAESGAQPMLPVLWHPDFWFGSVNRLPADMIDEWYPVSPDLYRATRYWLKVEKGWDFTEAKLKRLSLAIGDLLLVETDLDEIEQRRRQPGQLGIVGRRSQCHISHLTPVADSGDSTIEYRVRKDFFDKRQRQRDDEPPQPSADKVQLIVQPRHNIFGIVLLMIRRRFAAT